MPSQTAMCAGDGLTASQRRSGVASTSKPATKQAPGRRRTAIAAAREVTLLDYGAGNVRSVRNAIEKLGYTIKDVGATGATAGPVEAARPGEGAAQSTLTAALVCHALR